MPLFSSSNIQAAGYPPPISRGLYPRPERIANTQTLSWSLQAAGLRPRSLTTPSKTDAMKSGLAAFPADFCGKRSGRRSREFDAMTWGLPPAGCCSRWPGLATPWAARGNFRGRPLSADVPQRTGKRGTGKQGDSSRERMPCDGGGARPSRRVRPCGPFLGTKGRSVPVQTQVRCPWYKPKAVPSQAAALPPATSPPRPRRRGPDGPRPPAESRPALPGQGRGGGGCGGFIWRCQLCMLHSKCKHEGM